MVLAVAADPPLLHALTGTPLETNHAALVTALAHEARIVMSARALNTGSAKDISGVLRITRGGAWEDDDEAVGHETGSGELAEREVLYFVSGDGGARVFERGEELG